MIKQMTIIGLGIIGQSIASAIRQSEFCKTIVGFDHDQQLQSQVAAQGLIHKTAPDLASAIKSADFIVIAVDYSHYEVLFKDLAQHLKTNAVMTDTAAIKGPVIELAQQTLKGQANCFVPSHPLINIADNEGLPMAHLFAGSPIILTLSEKTDPHALEVVSAFWGSMGGEIEIMSAAQNDELLASTYHLPQLLAFTFVHSVKHKDSFQKYITKNFKEFTSLATNCPIMWRDLCIANRQAIIKEIGDFEESLGKIKKILETEETDSLLQHFNDAKETRENLN